jgi:hypothetical protein
VLGTDVAGILRVDRIRLVLESTEATETEAPRVQKLEDVLTVVAPGFVEDYVTGGRDVPTKQVTLRQVTSGSYRIFGDEAANWIRSEALIRLDLGRGPPARPPGHGRRGPASVPPDAGHRPPDLLRRCLRAADARLARLTAVR